MVTTDLRFPPGVRADDWETSQAADRMISGKRPTLAVKMLRAYLGADLTDEEAATRTELLRSCYWKRSSELRYLGFIEPTGATRQGVAGVARIVCRITPEGKQVLRDRAARQRTLAQGMLL